jgi:hypothetical protein
MILRHYQRSFATRIPSLNDIDKRIGFVRRGPFVRYKSARVLQA